MKRNPSLVALLALLTMTTMTPAFASATSGDEPFRLQRYTLPNGLRVWLQPRTDSQSVTALRVVYNASSAPGPATRRLPTMAFRTLSSTCSLWAASAGVRKRSRT